MATEETTEKKKSRGIPYNSETGAAAGRKGGVRSGEVRRQKRTMREELLACLSNGEVQKNITLALLAKALDGDIRAYEVIRDTAGEKPATRVEADVKAEVNPVFDDLFALLKDCPPQTDTKQQAKNKKGTSSSDD